MSRFSKTGAGCHPQQTVLAKCFHSSGSFVEFRKEEIEQSIPSRFEQMVAKYPDRVAVKTKDQTLTYDDFNRAANRVARAILAQRGNGAEPIALLLEHSAAVIVAIFGVLKAGKFYVALDPSHPRARTGCILDDIHARLIVTNRQNFRLATELAQHECQLLNIDELDFSLCTENPNLSTPPDAYAYVLYTSGSTGQPKGVIQNHRNVLQKVMTHTNDFHISVDDRLSLLYSCSFSASVRCIFCALLNGGALLPFDIKEDGLRRLANWLIQEKITIYFSVPTLFRHLVDTLNEREEISSVRLIYLGGEPLTRKNVELFKEHFSADCILVNSMASNETGTARQFFIGKGTEIEGGVVPVGYEVRDKEVLLFDEEGEEVGINQIGEIAVRSRYLSPGYWRSPDLTAAKFLLDSNGGDERLYLTGDLGLMRPDGSLVHVGRKDFQAKVRGYRVEVEEIEAALAQHPVVREVVVTVQGNDSPDKYLVAYIVPVQGSAITVSELRWFVAEKLPNYMVPSRFVFLEALPLSPNGKVDRRALPDPGNVRPGLDTPFVAPRTPVEKELARIWTEVLGLDGVGISDNFFDLGGHSLAASQVISRVIKSFQLDLPVQSLFESPTVAEMAAVIAQSQAQKLSELTRILAELESLSDEEAQEILARGDAEDDEGTEQ